MRIAILADLVIESLKLPIARGEHIRQTGAVLLESVHPWYERRNLRARLSERPSPLSVLVKEPRVTPNLPRVEERERDHANQRNGAHSRRAASILARSLP